MAMLKRETKVRAKNYREVKGQPYSRHEYIKSIPQSKITKFTMGDTKAQFTHQAILIAKESAQIRTNALEAARVATNRVLMEKLVNNYLLQILPYPHNILRENKMIFGAHADRLQDGMSRAFGKPIGTAARVKPGQEIMQIKVTKEAIETAKEALKRGSIKLPIPCRIVIEQIPN
jgi:large subunit ribosomal protein L10e